MRRDPPVEQQRDFSSAAKITWADCCAAKGEKGYIMANKILVVHTTWSGSTTEVADAIGKTLREGGAEVDVCRMSEVSSLDDYQAVIVGGPMILGWHREAVKFVARHQAALRQKPVAIFIMCLELTRSTEDTVGGVPIYQDPSLGHLPAKPTRLSFKEKQTTPTAYLGPILKKAPGIKPVSVGFFKGKLDYSTLSLLPKLFVKVIIRGQEGDYRNWDALNTWAADIGKALLATEQE
jgi:menaquinone-dependent protoporphyrinogen oxidase